MAKALVISKDVLNELKRLATVMEKDAGSFEKAQQQYVQATEHITSSTAQFASALYQFALEYANAPQLIDAKLGELGITTKQSSSVYYKIARLAFNDVKDDAGASLSQISKYGSLIEAAHQANMSASDFDDRVSVSIEHLMKKLQPNGGSDAEDKVKLGRQAIARFASDKTIELKDLDVPDGFSDGDDVELLARVESGRLVLFGVVPKGYGSPKALLQRIGAREMATKRKAGDLFADIARTIKLIATPNDARLCAGALQSKGGTSKFLASASGHVALLTFAGDDKLEGLDATFELTDWAKLTATVAALKGIPKEIRFEGSTITVEASLPGQLTMADYFAKKKKPITIGRQESSKLIFDVSTSHKWPEKMPKTDSKAIWLKDENLPETIDNLKSGTQYWIKQGAAGIHIGTEEVDDGIQISQVYMRTLQSALTKMRKLGPVTSLLDDPYLHLRCKADDDAQYHVAMKLS